MKRFKTHHIKSQHLGVYKWTTNYLDISNVFSICICICTTAAKLNSDKLLPIAASAIASRKQEIEMLKCLIMFTLLKCFYWTLLYLHSFPGKSPSLHGKQASKQNMWKRDSCSVLLSLGSHSPDPRTQHPPACLLMHFSEAFEPLIHPILLQFFFLAQIMSFSWPFRYHLA